MVKRLHIKNAVLKEIYFNDSLSCADISKRIGKSNPTIASAINELLNENIIHESGYAPSSGGRRPVTYTVNAAAFYSVAVAMDQLITKMAILNFKNELVGEVHEFELILKDNDLAHESLKNYIDSVIKGSGIDKNKIFGVGIGMPGFVDTKKGINYSYLLPVNETLTSYLHRNLSLPVFIENDSTLIALYEQRFGTAVNDKNVMVVNLGWGIGLGMIIQNQIYRGFNGFAGELSHIPFFNNKKMCDCGKYGCLETEASLKILIEKILQKINSGIPSQLSGITLKNEGENLQKIADAAFNGDRMVLETISEIGYDIGRACAILIHLFNPEKIVLSGRGAVLGDLWLPSVLQGVNENSIPRLAEATKIEVSKIGVNAELLGAAALALEKGIITYS